MTRFLISLLMAVLLLVPADAQIIINPGGGGGGGSGTVTSIATGCQATGGTITTSGTISTQLKSTGNSPTGAYTIAATDACNGVVLGSSVTGVTIPVITTSGFGSGSYFPSIFNNSGIPLTVTVTTSNIDGFTSFPLPNLTGFCFYSGSDSVYHFCNGNPQTLPSVAMGGPFLGAAGFFSANGITGTGTTAVTANQLYMMPVFLPAGYHATALALNVNTGVAATTALIGLYSMCHNTVDTGCSGKGFGQPNALLAGGQSTVSTATSGTTVTQTISYTIPYTGWYYIAVIDSGAPTLLFVPSNTWNPIGYAFSSGSGFIEAGASRAFGSFPATLNSSEAGNTFGGNNSVPLLGIQ